jgi:SAM-dependent methyltransferase
MFHLLEHTTDPAAEITAAARLLAPGGRLVIEIPNPQCRLGDWLGRWWFPWFQPQHQFLLNEATVRRVIASAGLETTKVEYLMTTGDFLLASMLAVRSVASIGEVPWAPAPGLARRVLDASVWGVALPVFVSALIADVVYNSLPASPRTSNAFRITAAWA